MTIEELKALIRLLGSAGLTYDNDRANDLTMLINYLNGDEHGERFTKVRTVILSAEYAQPGAAS